METARRGFGVETALYINVYRIHLFDLDNELQGSRELYHLARVGTHDEKISACDPAHSRKYHSYTRSVVYPCLIGQYLRYWVTCGQYPAKIPRNNSPEKRQTKTYMRYPMSPIRHKIFGCRYAAQVTHPTNEHWDPRELRTSGGQPL